jgi:membrane associated rhomboid family serine protease
MQPRQVQFDFGSTFRRPPPATLVLMVLTGVFSVAAMVDVGFGTRGQLAAQFMFEPTQVLDHWKVWTPFSYLFLMPDPVYLIFHEVFGLWVFAAPLERSWGQRRFLVYFFGTGTGAAIIFTLAGMWIDPLRGAGVVGPWVAADAIALAWVLTNWHGTVFLFVFPVPAPYLLIATIGIPTLYVLMGNWGWIVALLALGIGYLMMKGTLSPRGIWLYLRAWWIEKSLKRRASKLRVVPPPGSDAKKPKYLN